MASRDMALRDAFHYQLAEYIKPLDQEEYQKSYQKYGVCDNISFGYVLGNKSAFLVQNLFPVTEKYVLNEYIDTNTKQPITIPKKLMTELHKKQGKRFDLINRGNAWG